MVERLQQANPAKAPSSPETDGSPCARGDPPQLKRHHHRDGCLNFDQSIVLYDVLKNFLIGRLLWAGCVGGWC